MRMSGYHDKVFLSLLFSMLFLLMGLEVVLGVSWLEKHGMVVCNWKNMTMEFEWNGQQQLLQGLDDPPIQLTSMEALSKQPRQIRAIFFVCFQAVIEENHHDLPIDLQQLLNNCEDIFQEPNKLPPIREI